MAAVNVASYESKSPGVYVQEVPSQIKAIAGVSTSTAGFIGVSASASTTQVPEKNTETFTGGGAKKSFELTGAAKTDADTYTVTVKVGGAAIETAGATIKKSGSKSTLEFTTPPADKAAITVEYQVEAPAPAPKAVLCTNFGEFKTAFPDEVRDQDQYKTNAATYKVWTPLAHAVYGFFNNGGGRCYVIREDSVTNALKVLATIDEIALVAAPGETGTTEQEALIEHCDQEAGVFYRVAILDGATKGTDKSFNKTKDSKYAALYHPWIQVADPKDPKKTVDVPPSGHVAGIYARVDAERGVHKAPANEVIRGALGVTQPLSKLHQNDLNPAGINCIRVLNNNVLVWGARTLGGTANQDLKYINVRRTLLFLRKSIDQGTQWVVFEPNTPALWQKITRNVTAFLTNVWRSGALFGTTPEEAFYVKCDRESNPSEVREAGLVVTEIGVAIARPAEFVVFQISQFTAPA